MAQPNHHVWYELITADMAAARTFYASVIGWEMRDASMPGMAYTLCSTARGSVCGLVDVAAEAAPAGEKPCWIGYVGVDDVDAAATRAIAHGGVVEVVPQTVPEVSRFAILTDPQGVVVHAIHSPAAQEAVLLPLASRVGVDLAETQIGTAAPGVTLRTGQASLVLGGEHFFGCLQVLHCAVRKRSVGPCAGF